MLVCDQEKYDFTNWPARRRCSAWPERCQSRDKFRSDLFTVKRQILVVVSTPFTIPTRFEIQNKPDVKIQKRENGTRSIDSFFRNSSFRSSCMWAEKLSSMPETSRACTNHWKRRQSWRTWRKLNSRGKEISLGTSLDEFLRTAC